MKKLSYIELINRFWEYYSIKRISDIDTTMYFYLLNECNIRRWLNPFELQTRNLEASLQVSRKTITEARNRLKQRGLIDFREARGRGPTTYLLEGVAVSNEMLTDRFCVSSEKHKGNSEETQGDFAFPQRNTRVTQRVTQSKHKGNSEETQDDFSPIILEDIEDIKTKDKDFVETRACARDEFDDMLDGLFSVEKRASLETFCMKNRVSFDEVRGFADEVVAEWRLTGVSHLNPEDAVKHLVNHIRVKINCKRNESDKTDRFSEYRGVEPPSVSREDFDYSF